MKHIEYIANGLGGQSMYLLWLAAEGRIPARISITADTGWEDDCDLMDGTKTTAREFWASHVLPFARQHGIDAYFVRAKQGDKNPLPAIPDYLRHKVQIGQLKAVPVPMFGSRKGRLKQSCTDKWKIAAMKQQCRLLGAKTARSAQGIHWGERAARVKGQYIGQENGWTIYQPTVMRKKKIVRIKWLTHYYPLVDLQMNREQVRYELDKLGIPYLISSECCGCPHADPWRWLRRTPETIEKVAQIEDMYNGNMFFTDLRIPLRDAIQLMKDKKDNQGYLFDKADFSCTQGICGV